MKQNVFIESELLSSFSRFWTCPFYSRVRSDQTNIDECFDMKLPRTLQNGNPVLRRDSVWDLFHLVSLLNILAPQYLFKSGASCHEAQHLLGIPKHHKNPLFKQAFRPIKHKKILIHRLGKNHRKLVGAFNPFEKY